MMIEGEIRKRIINTRVVIGHIRKQRNTRNQDQNQYVLINVRSESVCLFGCRFLHIIQMTKAKEEHILIDTGTHLLLIILVLHLPIVIKNQREIEDTRRFIIASAILSGLILLSFIFTIEVQKETPS